MESVRKKARSELVVPEMRSTITGACALLDVQAFVVDVDDGSCVDGEEAVGADRGTAVRAWFRRFCAFKKFLTPSIAIPVRGNFLGILGRRVRRLGSSGAQKRVLLFWGTDFRAALNVYRNAEQEVLVHARDGDEAVDSHDHVKPCRQ